MQPLRRSRLARLIAAGAGLLLLAAGLLLLAGCAGQGILPQSSLPSDPSVPPPPFPSFTTPDPSDDEAHRVLTAVEQEELQAELARLAKEREASVQRRIQRSK